MGDESIFQTINALSAEEEALYQRAGDGRGLSGEEDARLAAIQVELDRCFDLLHQRQARRSAGMDPDDASLRSAEVVEHYQQ